MLGGFIIGMVETVSKAYLSSQWSDAIVFGILILVLIVKPTGILGKNEREKV
jgi:branched-chain amino acid transport system permease protein